MSTRLSLYADADGALSFHRTDGALEVSFELADGYRVSPGFTGVLAVFGPPGRLGMTLEQALTARVLFLTASTSSATLSASSPRASANAPAAESSGGTIAGENFPSRIAWPIASIARCTLVMVAASPAISVGRETSLAPSPRAGFPAGSCPSAAKHSGTLMAPGARSRARR